MLHTRRFATLRGHVTRWWEERRASKARATTLKDLPGPARLFVVGILLAAATVLAVMGPLHIPNVRIFLVLLVASSLASALKLRLPLGSSASNLSISYTFDFAALLLLGTGPAMLLAAVSAWTQSRIATARYNPTFRVAFNVAALMLTVQAAGHTFEYVGGQPGTFSILANAKPLVATALVYYLTNTALVAIAVALTTRQPLFTAWHANFLWTAPSYFVGAGAAAAAIGMWQVSDGWLLPLALAPVYLTFRSYRMYVDRIAAEKHHNEEAVRLLEAARSSEQRYALAAAGSNDGLWDWDVPADALYCSERWKLMIGLSPETPIANIEQWLQHVNEEDRQGLREALDAHLQDRTPHFEHEYRMPHLNGETRWVLCRGIAVRDDHGRPIRMAGSQTDVTEWRRVQETLARAARHDPLTGLPNRALFGELLEREIAQAARVGFAHYAVLFIDLDGFKLVNDSLGHLIGDQFLIAIAHRLQSRLRPGDALARLGGDEFAVLITNVSNPNDVRLITERMQEALATPFDIEGREIYASASIGIVLGGEQYRSVADLLRDADTAMYRAKAAGRGGYEMFDPRMHASAMSRLTLETELRRAVERNEFVVFYQPIVELVSSEIVGLEALIRWARPDREMAMPAEFIGVAEETGLIVPITHYVLGEASRQLAAWQRQFGRPMYVSVNISSKLFADEEFVDQVEAAIAASGIRPGTLCLEITESVLMKHSEVVDRNFERLRRMQVPLYLDDFGTGYSSLGYLQRYPVDALKLDQSFVARMGTDENCPIANVIVTLARELSTGLVAEGVETAAQAARLLALDCPNAQGTLFSEPLRAADVEALLMRATSEARRSVLRPAIESAVAA
ncbi:MAG: EAL domain-containing protein [Acidobacteria bacterium]|nr:EAL domain-containing protein [Acidobacteriota bacterium]